jgi:hypothetical protein
MELLPRKLARMLFSGCNPTAVLRSIFVRRSGGFRRLAPQHVAHASGWEVFGVDRFHLGYREGPYVAHIEVDMGTEITILAKSLERWEPPNQAEPLPTEKRREIIDRITSSLVWEGERYSLE